MFCGFAHTAKPSELYVSNPADFRALMVVPSISIRLHLSRKAAFDSRVTEAMAAIY